MLLLNVRRDRTHTRRIYSVTVVLLWLVLALVVLLNKRGVFTPDIKPEIYLAPGRMTGHLLAGWLDTQQLGFPNFNVGLAPVTAFVALLRELGLSAALSVRLLHLGLLMLGGWGASRLFVEVAGPRSRRTGRLLAGVLYVANPYTVVAGDTLAITLPYAFLPWQVLFLLRALERPGSWRWPAAFALTFFAMSGMNAGVVPALQLVYVPALVWYVAGRRVVTTRAVAGALARCGLLTLLVSLYWLVPAVAARGVGSNVVANSETLSGIAGPSSFAEVMRGLGLWVMYGRGQDGPWQPGFTSYLDNPIVITLSFALPALTAAAVMVTGGAVRRLALGMVVLAGVVMVGIFPPDHPSPMGRLLRFGFDHVPTLGAFRTTNKAGAVLILGVALLVGAAGAVVVRRLLPGQLVAVGAALAVVLVGATWPAWSGGLFSDQLRIPRYWHQAAAAVDSGSSVQRVWLVPGQVQSHYRWSRERVDDIDKSLLSRPSLVETTVPNPSAVAANFLSAVDTQMQEGSLPPGAVSAAARYMGVSDVLVRNDLVWEQTKGARPAVVQDQVARDPGLIPVANFGRAGQNTRSPTEAPASAAEAGLPPVQHYRVEDSRLMARVESVRGSVLVSGDGWSLGPLVAAGLLPGDPAFRYVGELSSSDVAQAVKAGTRLVITDTNRRRTATTSQLADSQGPLLPAGRAPGPSRVLFGPDAQTTLRLEGGSVSASSSGGVFLAEPNVSPENAFDGDPRTAWVFGDFGRAVGQSIRLRTPTPREISEVALSMTPRGSVTISEVRLRVGAVARTVEVPSSGTVRVAFPPQLTEHVRLKVTGTRGSGINAVGVNEISVPGVQVRRVAVVPNRVGALLRDLDPVATRALGSTPIDVVLSRVSGTGSAEDDEETGLNRDFTVPQSRSYRLYGLVRPDSSASDDSIDHLLGVTGDVTATSSSRAFGAADVRASYAVDGNPYTAWSPADPVIGSWLELDRRRPRRVDHIDVQQLDSNATKVQVYLDGRLAAAASLRPGSNRIPVPSQRAHRLRLVISAWTGTGPVQISEVGFGGARMSRHPERAWNGCVTVGTLDGKPLRMRPVDRLTDLSPTVFAACDGALSISAGTHRLRAVRDWMPDQLVFRDPVGELPVEPTVTKPATVRRVSSSHWKVTATLPRGQQLLVLGQNYDPRWVATMDGRSIGRAVVADGYSAAWLVDSPGRHTFDIRFSPQRYASAALGVSAIAVLVCVVLALRRDEHSWPSSAPQPVRSGGRRSRAARAVPWLAVVASAWVLGGPVVGTAAVGLVAWHVWRAPPPLRLLQMAVWLTILTPVAFMLGNVVRWGTISPYLVGHNQWPHWLTGCALLLLCVGVWRQDSRPRLPVSRPAGADLS